MAIALVAVLAGCVGRVDQVEVPAAVTALGPGPGLPGSRGSTVLAAMDERIAELAGTPLRLRGGIAYYPACSDAMSRAFYGPVLILIGDRDDWTPAGPCEGLQALQAQRAPGRVRLTVYRGATHSFDFNAPRRWNEYGKLLEFDAAASRDAQRRIESFLDEVVGKNTAR